MESLHNNFATHTLAKFWTYEGKIRVEELHTLYGFSSSLSDLFLQVILMT